MATKKFSNPVPEEIPPVAPGENSDPVSPQTIIVALGGYNHQARQSGDSIEIERVGLPGDFTMENVSDGYIPGEFKKRFDVLAHELTAKTLRVKIALSCLLLFLALSCSAQLPDYILTQNTPALPYSATNSLTVDATQASALGLQVNFTGYAAHTTTAIIGVTNSANATNGQTITIALNGTNYVYTWTNAPTASTDLQQTNTAGAAATNLQVKLATDFAATLLVTQLSSNQVQLVTLLNPGLGVSETGTWATNLLTTNAIAGGLIFKGSNSLDRVTWFRDSSKDFTAAYSGTSAVSYITNWTGLGAVGWWSWAVENAATNYAGTSGLIIQSAVKRGL